MHATVLWGKISKRGHPPLLHRAFRLNVLQSLQMDKDALKHHSGTEKVPPKNFCDKDFAELSGELSGAIRLKTLVLLF